MRKRYWGIVLEWLGDGMIIACGAIILTLLIPIALYGEVLSYEDNPVILWSELVLGGLIIILGINRLIGDWRSRHE